MEPSRRRHLWAWLESSLLYSHDHHNRKKGKPWLPKFWCPVSTCYYLRGCEGRRRSCLASCPASDPAVAPPAWHGSVSSQSQGLLRPANDCAAGSPGLHPPSGEAAANYRACWPRQWPGQKSQLPVTPHPLALVAVVSSSTFQNHRGYYRRLQRWGLRIPHSTDMGKQDPRGGPTHTQSHTWAWTPGPSLSLRIRLISRHFTCEVCSRGTWGKLRGQDVCSVPNRGLIIHSLLSSCVTLNKTGYLSEHSFWVITVATSQSCE